MILNKWTLRPKAVDRPTEIEEPAVIFIDYDGTELYTYSLDEANALTELPANPTHDGLVSQGWNWTLAQIKGQLLDTPETTIVVGQLYVTASGATEIDIELGDVWKSPYLTMGVNGTATIDWGDNSTADTVTGTDIRTRINTQHFYTNGGNYTIKITVNNGSARLLGQTNAYSFFNNNSGSGGTDSSRQYSGAVNFVRFGNSMSYGDSTFMKCVSLRYVTISSSTLQKGSFSFRYCNYLKSVTIPYVESIEIGSYCFQECFALEFVSFPYGLTWMNEYLFRDCVSLKYATIPLTVTDLMNNIFQGCRSLTKVIVPSTTSNCSNLTLSDSPRVKTVIFKGGTTTSSYSCGLYRNCFLLENITLPYNGKIIYQHAFNNCQNLKNINLPSNITSIGTNAFQSCTNLESITIPSTVTTIGNNAFNGCKRLSSIEFPEGLERIENQTCMGCSGLSSVIIPSTVNFIGSYAFRSATGIKEIHIKPVEPPELDNIDAFSNIPSDCIFYVPSGSLTAYQNATNWSDFASYMQEE